MGQEQHSTGGATYGATRIYLAVRGSEAWRSFAMRQQLLEQLRLPDVSDRRLNWDQAIEWDEPAKLARLSCIGTGAYDQVRDAAIAKLASAVNHILPERESSVTVEKASVPLRRQRPRHSTRERWGWYAVVLVLEASWIRDEPQAAAFMAGEFRKWKRFGSASFAWSETESAATFSVELVARSADGADAGAREALESLMWAAVTDPGSYSLTSLKVEWLRNAPPSE